jgi:hypothetical protein
MEAVVLVAHLLAVMVHHQTQTAVMRLSTRVRVAAVLGLVLAVLRLAVMVLVESSISVEE